MEHIISRLLQEYERGKVTRRQLIQVLASGAAAAAAGASIAEAAPATATYINHVSMQVADYRKTRDFYSGLFGMKVEEDNCKTECTLAFGQNTIIARNAAGRPGGKAGVDHIAYTLANWDTDPKIKAAMDAELKKRGLMVRVTNNSFHVQDPDGLEVQMGGKEQ
jgi:catechol 2,3-dioxygenase-like lactoylglutathione lyase family enzyme